MPRPFRFGVVGGNVPSGSAWIEQARRVEGLGYSTLLLPDRLIMNFAPFTALMAAASATTVLRVGTYVFCNDFRHPALLAKEAATLDQLSAGRFELGIGAGVGPSDYQQMGLPFESPGTRVSRLAESLHIIKALFTEESVSSSGKYYTLASVRGVPAPLQKPHPPILVAGTNQRMLSLAAREGDIVAVGAKITPQGPDPSDASPDEKIAWIREAAGERFARIELARTEFSLVITDSSAEVATIPNRFSLPQTHMSTEQAVDYLLEQRERYSFSYIQVSGAQIENFAPIVERLAGK